MGRSMYKIGKQTKEKARQQKQMEKATKRLAAKQQKAGILSGDLDAIAPATEQEVGEEAVST